MNYQLKLNLKSLNNACVVDIKGKTATKRCVCIPIDDNEVFCTEKGWWLSANCYENTNFGQSHTVRLSKSSEWFKSLPDEERKAQQPYIGNLKESPFQNQSQVPPADTTVLASDIGDGSADDLPF